MDGQFIAIIVGGQMEDAWIINPKVVAWFKGRGISEKTLRLGGIYSGTRLQNGSIIRSDDGGMIVFPFFWEGKVVNEKYRDAAKRFSQQKGGKKVFWNGDVLFDPAFQTGETPLVITEGEIDALSFIEAGYPWVVSVPSGAPTPTSKPIESPPLPEDDKAYAYVAAAMEVLAPIKEIIIATDADAPGRRLADELVIRLGRVRCKKVVYPKGCKDANEVLQKHGPEAVIQILSTAEPYKLSGIYRLCELPPEPDLKPISTGWGQLDRLLMPCYPGFMVITGTANSGKSTWANQLLAQFTIHHEINVGIASFEMRINPFVTNTLKKTYALFHRRDPDKWLNERFTFISPEPDSEYDIEWLIERFIWAAIRYNIKVALIDPWNEIEHAVRRGENLHEYTGRAIRALKRLGREYGILVILVAHPTKGAASRVSAALAADKKDMINLYDVSDSAHFSNKADWGVTIERVVVDGVYSELTNVHVTKVRYQPDTGIIGSENFRFTNGTFGGSN